MRLIGPDHVVFVSAHPELIVDWCRSHLGAARHPATGATVAQVPKPLSPDYRDRARRCRTTTGAATSSIYRDRTSPGGL
jgi:hypothetical protein